MLPEKNRGNLYNDESVGGERVRYGAMYAVWLNLEGGYEHRVRHGFDFLAAGGVGLPVATNATHRHSECCDFLDTENWVADRTPAPYVRVGFGWAF